jgi:hypothetical protein
VIDSLAAALQGVGFGPLQVSVLGLLSQDELFQSVRGCLTISDELLFSVEVSDAGLCVC